MNKRTGIYIKESGVYRIQNMVTGKIYIGSSNDIYKRIGRHKYVLKKGLNENIRMKQDCEKYGLNSFLFGIVEYCEKGKLKEREQHYFQLWNPQYNVWKNIYSAKNREYTKEQLKYFKTYQHGPKDLKKFSETLKKAWVIKREKYTSEELFKIKSDSRKGIKHSEETKKLFSLQRKGKKKPSGFGEKIREVRLNESSEVREYRIMRLKEAFELRKLEKITKKTKVN